MAHFRFAISSLQVLSTIVVSGSYNIAIARHRILKIIDRDSNPALSGPRQD
jgi:hypothetical protein